MKPSTIKSILGKYISDSNALIYCHVHKIIYLEQERSIASVAVKTVAQRMFHWFVAFEWKYDERGNAQITHTKILREDEIDGYPNPNKRQPLPQLSERLQPQAGRNADLPIY